MLYFNADLSLSIIHSMLQLSVQDTAFTVSLLHLLLKTVNAGFLWRHSLRHFSVFLLHFLQLPATKHHNALGVSTVYGEHVRFCQNCTRDNSTFKESLQFQVTCFLFEDFVVLLKQHVPLLRHLQLRTLLFHLYKKACNTKQAINNNRVSYDRKSKSHKPFSQSKQELFDPVLPHNHITHSFNQSLYQSVESGRYCCNCFIQHLLHTLCLRSERVELCSRFLLWWASASCWECLSCSSTLLSLSGMISSSCSRLNISLLTCSLSLSRPACNTSTSCCFCCSSLQRLSASERLCCS